MRKEFDPSHLDIPAFSQAGAELNIGEPLANYSRLHAESALPEAPATLQCSARGETRMTADGVSVPWLHLSASAQVPLLCQRCMQPVETLLQSERWFRFVADEEKAALEDDAADEDVMAVSTDFDLRALAEDELLMGIPYAPMHEQCPAPVPMLAVDADFDIPDHPFAVLAGVGKKEK